MRAMYLTETSLVNRAFLLADVGVPMIFVTFPLMIYALVPIVLLEACVGDRSLQLRFGRSAWVFSVANLVSTIIGVPAAWVVMVALEFGLGTAILPHVSDKVFATPVGKVLGFIMTSAWLGPSDTDLYWAVPLAALVLLVPSFFFSWYIEAFILDQMVEPDWPTVKSASLKANLASYSLLFLCGSVWLLVSLLRYRPK